MQKYSCALALVIGISALGNSQQIVEPPRLPAVPPMHAQQRSATELVNRFRALPVAAAPIAAARQALAKLPPAASPAATPTTPITVDFANGLTAAGTWGGKTFNAMSEVMSPSMVVQLSANLVWYLNSSSVVRVAFPNPFDPGFYLATFDTRLSIPGSSITLKSNNATITCDAAALASVVDAHGVTSCTLLFQVGGPQFTNVLIQMTQGAMMYPVGLSIVPFTP
jgi:hypothetical protein